MKTTTFELAQTGISSLNLEQFLISYILECAKRSYGESFSWQLPGTANSERRLFLGFDESKALFNISFEVVYQLFAGDTHFFVKKVGTVKESEIGSHLPGLVTKALEQVNNWKPTYEIF